MFTNILKILLILVMCITLLFHQKICMLVVISQNLWKLLLSQVHVLLMFNYCNIIVELNWLF